MYNVFMSDIKYRFTCGESNLYLNVTKPQHIMPRALVDSSKGRSTCMSREILMKHFVTLPFGVTYLKRRNIREFQQLWRFHEN